MWNIEPDEFVESGECEECGEIVTSDNPECPNCGIELVWEGPMMDFFYPLRDYIGEPEEEVKKLWDLPLVIVEDRETGGHEEYGLALSGGGMDFTWEICLGYIRLGFLPPVYFCGLPVMAGIEPTEENRLVVEACKKSLEISIRELNRKLDHLNVIENRWKEKGRL